MPNKKNLKSPEQKLVKKRKARMDGLPVDVQDRVRQIRKTGGAFPVVKLESPEDENGGMSIKVNDDKGLGVMALFSAFGINSATYIHDQIGNLTMASARADSSNEKIGQNLTSDLAFISSINPEDAIESMLAVQMATAHRAAMFAMEKFSRSQETDKSNSAANQATKFLNLYLRQMEMLNKHRGKGQQKMTVEHVHVNEGGQAIIGNVEGGGGNGKK